MYPLVLGKVGTGKGGKGEKSSKLSYGTGTRMINRKAISRCMVGEHLKRHRVLETSRLFCAPLLLGSGAEYREAGNLL